MLKLGQVPESPDGTEVKFGWSLGGESWVEQLHAHQVVGLEILGGVIEAGFHNVEEDIVPVVDLVKVFGLDHEAAQLDPKMLIGPALLPRDEEVVLEIGLGNSSSFENAVSLSLDVVEVHSSEGVTLKNFY